MTYTCPRCGGAFTNKRDARSHYRTVHIKGQPPAWIRRARGIRKLPTWPR